MKTKLILALALTFLLGVVAGALARGRTIEPTVYRGKSKSEAAKALMDLAKGQAGKGSWENLAVARTYYLGGMKSDGVPIIDSVTTSKKVEGSDWMRVGEIYYDANEWQKAKDAFDVAMKLDPKNASFYAEAGAFYNLKGDRTKAEELFDRAFQLQSDEVWRTTDIAGSYLGIPPRRQ
jgi:tetratricopeptide (TPR) repeat protein